MIKTFRERKYRNTASPAGLVSFNVRVKETDLLVSAEWDLKELASLSVRRARGILEEYAAGCAAFAHSLEPVDAAGDAPGLIRSMCLHSRACGVGPMASVAGAVAEYVGADLASESGEVIIENGGDVFMKTMRSRVVGIFAGDSVLSGRLSIEINPGDTPCGVCSSSGTVGHSLNFGEADAVVVCSRSAILADAAATACSNMVKDETCIEEAIAFAGSIGGVDGIVVIVKDRFGAWGGIKILEN